MVVFNQMPQQRIIHAHRQEQLRPLPKHNGSGINCLINNGGF